MATAAATAAGATAAAATDSSLPALLTRALSTHPVVDEQAAKASQSGYEVLRAKARHWPTFTVGGDAGLTGSDSAATRALSASVNLWSGGAIEGAVAMNQSSFEAARSRVAQACTEAAAQISEAYLGVLKAQALDSRAQVLVKDHARILGMAQEIAQIDRGRRLDVDLVSSRQAQVLLSAMDAAAQARQAQATLERELGFAAQASDAGLVTQLNAWVPASADDALRATLAASPALQAARLEIDAAERAVGVARASRLPQVNLVLSHGNNTASLAGGNHSSVRVQTQWVFNGGNDVYGEPANREQVRAARQRVLEIERQITLDVSRLWDNLALQRQRLASNPEQLRAAQAVVDANTELFKFGKRSMLDLLTAYNDLNNAWVAQLQARYDAWAYAARLAARTGTLLAQLPLPPKALCATQGIELPKSIFPSLQ